MADYSWCVIRFASTDPEIVDRACDLFGHPDRVTEEDGTTVLEGEKSYGMAEDVEAFLTENGIAYSRFSDGKYDYDGDEAHWKPGMAAARVFPMLNNGGRVFSEADYRAFRDDPNGSGDLAAYVHDWFSFRSPVEPTPQPDEDDDEHGVECEDCNVNGEDCRTHGAVFKAARQAIAADPERTLAVLVAAGLAEEDA
jgi:hypothetical protein